jgi:hypothetical protein
MDLLKEHTNKIEKLGFLVYLVLIFVLVIFKKEWVLSAVIGALTGIINFRVQVKGLNALAEGKSAFHVTGNFYLRMLIIGSVLYLSFSNPSINPYVVFAFMLFFQFLIFLSGFFIKK